MTTPLFAIMNKPHIEKKYLLTCTPKEDSNQLAHARSPINVLVVRMKKLCILMFPKCAQWRFWSDCAMRSLIWIFARRKCPKVRTFFDDTAQRCSIGMSSPISIKERVYLNCVPVTKKKKKKKKQLWIMTMLSVQFAQSVGSDGIYF